MNASMSSDDCFISYLPLLFQRTSSRITNCNNIVTRFPPFSVRALELPVYSSLVSILFAVFKQITRCTTNWFYRCRYSYSWQRCVSFAPSALEFGSHWSVTRSPFTCLGRVTCRPTKMEDLPLLPFSSSSRISSYSIPLCRYRSTSGKRSWRHVAMENAFTLLCTIERGDDVSCGGLSSSTLCRVSAFLM